MSQAGSRKPSISVKSGASKAPKKPPQAPPANKAPPLAKKATAKGTPSEQQQMVAQIMKQHREKQQKLKALEDKVYVEAEVEKRKPKVAERPKVVVKQKLTFPAGTQAQLDDPTKSNQEKAQVLAKDLGVKLGQKVPDKAPPKPIEVKQPPKESEPRAKPPQPDFAVAVGAGIKGKLAEDAESQSRST